MFQRFPRLVRDMCRSIGKEAEFHMEGEETELDKTVIEQIADPLVHLVRNSMDHGIELPTERERVGKPRVGTLRLKAYNKGSNVVIEVSDDGHGMDPGKLKRKAIEKGLITAEYAATLDDRLALDLIFLPGFSTAEKVTDISGRGVGMDVVRNNIRHLQGTITLESQLGKGSKTTIHLPTSLMVFQGVLVEVAGEEYIFPVESILEMIKIPRERIHSHDRTQFVQVRDEIYSLLDLAEHFRVQENNSDRVKSNEVSIALVQTERSRLGVMVDRFVTEVEVIVKPLGNDFSKLRLFQGATIMGDGRVVLVINPSGIGDH